MANLDNIVKATEVLTDDSENGIDGSRFKPEGNQVTVSDVQRDEDGSAAAIVVTKGVVETETVFESLFDSNRGFDLMDKEKNSVGNLSSAGDSGTNDSGGVVLGRDEKINNGDVFSLNNAERGQTILKKRGRNSSDVEMCRDGNGRWNGEKMEDGDHGFRVGDFVWGKIKSYPWWPGQVYDPRDASEFAVKHSQEGRLLVAFFGDGSCSWCLPSQLVPFIENFKQMSMDASSKSVLNAIQRAIDEVRRLVESKMTCQCIPRDHLARPVVANAGVRAGVLVPEVDINQLPIPEYKPSEIRTQVMNFAKVVSVDNVIELGVVRSWLSAFYYAKRGYPLAVFSEPLHIEGLEDTDDNGTVFTSDFSFPIEVPIHGPQDDKIYHRRKQKSVAELMGEKHDDEPKSKKRATLKAGKDDGKSATGSSLKKHKSIDGEVEEGSSQGHSSTRKSGRKRGVKAESDNAAEGELKEMESFEAKEELENISSPRERKKSKYLSPPYTNLSWRFVKSGSKMESEFYMDITRASELDDETSDAQRLDASVRTNARVLENDERLTFSESDVDVPVSELLSEIEFAALDPFYLTNEGSLDMVYAFISAFRGSTYSHGSDYRVYQKCKANQGKGNAPQPTDDLISDVRLIRQKLDIMTALLENYCSKISTEEKSSLKDEMKLLMEYVETASDKVRSVAENATS